MKNQIILTTNGFKRFYKFENTEEFNQWERDAFSAWANQYNKKADEYKEKVIECFPFETKELKNESYAVSCVEMYCGYHYANINGFFRGESFALNNNTNSMELMKYILGMEKCFLTAPVTDKDLICYRSMSNEEIEFYKHNQMVNNYLSVSGVRDSLKSKGYNSKSIQTILVPAGTKVLCPNMIRPVIMNGKSFERYESELILPRCMKIKRKFGKYILSNF